jgi:lipooligosaccharide transport system permease protein
VRAVADWLPLTAAVELVRPLFLDRWPDQPVRHLAVLIAFAGVSFWIALALTRKRFRN